MISIRFERFYINSIIKSSILPVFGIFILLIKKASIFSTRLYEEMTLNVYLNIIFIFSLLKTLAYTSHNCSFTCLFLIFAIIKVWILLVTGKKTNKKVFLFEKLSLFAWYSSQTHTFTEPIALYCLLIARKF